MIDEKYFNHVNSGKVVKCNSLLHLIMQKHSDDAMKIIAQLNNAYHTKEEIIELFSILTGTEVDKDFNLFPPFYTDVLCLQIVVLTAMFSACSQNENLSTINVTQKIEQTIENTTSQNTEYTEFSATKVNKNTMEQNGLNNSETTDILITAGGQQFSAKRIII